MENPKTAVMTPEELYKNDATFQGIVNTVMAALGEGRIDRKRLFQAVELGQKKAEKFYKWEAE